MNRRAWRGIIYGVAKHQISTHAPLFLNSKLYPVVFIFWTALKGPGVSTTILVLFSIIYHWLLNCSAISTPALPHCSWESLRNGKQIMYIAHIHTHTHTQRHLFLKPLNTFPLYWDQKIKTKQEFPAMPTRLYITHINAASSDPYWLVQSTLIQCHTGLFSLPGTCSLIPQTLCSWCVISLECPPRTLNQVQIRSPVYQISIQASLSQYIPILPE